MIGVVLAVGAIAVPFTLRQFERRTETEAIDRLGLLVRSARSEARSSGVPVEVRCDPTGRRITAIRVDPRNPPSFDGRDADLGEPDDSSLAILDAWASIRLPESLAIAPMVEDDLFALGGFALDPVADGGDRRFVDSDPWESVTRLLLLVPDGTVILLEDLELRSSVGPRRIAIDPWTALMTLSSVTPVDDADSEATFSDVDESGFETDDDGPGPDREIVTEGLE